MKMDNLLNWIDALGIVGLFLIIVIILCGAFMLHLWIGLLFTIALIVWLIVLYDYFRSDLFSSRRA